MRVASKWIACFCLLLTLWAAAAEPIHHHSSDAAPGSCSLCIVAHSTAPTAISNFSDPILIPVGIMEADPVSDPTYLSAHDIGIRGPPSVG